MGISNFPPHLILLSLSLIFNVIDSTTAVSIQHESNTLSIIISFYVFFSRLKFRFCFGILAEERNRPGESAIHWTELLANGELDQRSKRALFLNLINAQQAKAEENIRSSSIHSPFIVAALNYYDYYYSTDFHMDQTGRRKDFFKVLVAATGTATTIDEREFNDSQSALTP